MWIDHATLLNSGHSRHYVDVNSLTLKYQKFKVYFEIRKCEFVAGICPMQGGVSNEKLILNLAIWYFTLLFGSCSTESLLNHKILETLKVWDKE